MSTPLSVPGVRYHRPLLMGRGSVKKSHILEIRVRQICSIKWQSCPCVRVAITRGMAGTALILFNFHRNIQTFEQFWLAVRYLGQFCAPCMCIYHFCCYSFGNFDIFSFVNRCSFAAEVCPNFTGK